MLNNAQVIRRPHTVDSVAEVENNSWIHFIDASEIKIDQLPQQSLSVPFSVWQNEHEALAKHPFMVGVQLDSAQVLSEIVEQLLSLPVIVLPITDYTDGRVYSHSYLLRTRHGYQGEIRAVGEVHLDQLNFLARCGVNALELSKAQNMQSACEAFKQFSAVYQSSADDERSIIKRRRIGSLQSEPSLTNAIGKKFQAENSTIKQSNVFLRRKSATKVIEWVYAQNSNSMVTTNFSPYSTVLLHMLTQIQPDIPVLWIDTGYNKAETYRFAETAIEKMSLNVSVYTPRVTAARRNALLGGVPSVFDEEHAEFTHQAKLEPFERAMNESNAEYWFTAVRREQTEVRAKMDTISQGPYGVTKVAPLLDWTLADMQAYIDKHDLPNELDYFDPTKVISNRECGLHTLSPEKSHQDSAQSSPILL